MLRGLATISFWADDLKAARAWYSELLGIEPYFALPDAENPACIEFRLGDYQDELGIVDAKYAPHDVASPGGVIAYWHVDDVAATLERLTAMGAKEYEPLTPRSLQEVRLGGHLNHDASPFPHNGRLPVAPRHQLVKNACSSANVSSGASSAR